MDLKKEHKLRMEGEEFGKIEGQFKKRKIKEARKSKKKPGIIILVCNVDKFM